MAKQDIFSPLRWQDGALHLIDQLRLPGEETWIVCETPDQVHRAIRDMVVRGAPAIGCAAAYGVAIAARKIASESPSLTRDDAIAKLVPVLEHLATARPTAVNLFGPWTRCAGWPARPKKPPLPARWPTLWRHTRKAFTAMTSPCARASAKNGAELIPDGATVLTHCNAGALATGGYGTALGVIRAAREAGKKLRVIADETRPYLQGARLTAWELVREGFDVTVVPDSAAAALLRRGEIQCCVVGADRIAANGDVANKIGTYGVALAANVSGVPFYVAAPRSTIDLKTASGDDIPIEEREGKEMLVVGNTRIAPANVQGRYPAFDVTPANLITAIVTDTNVARSPYADSLASAVRAGSDE